MYKCEYFDIKELVPPKVYHMVDNKDLLWLIFNSTALHIIDFLRRDYGPATINNWQWGGNRTMSGFRPFDPNDEYALLSQHRFGRAFDIIFRDASPDAVRRDILNRKYPYMNLIKALELGVSWLHFDQRNHNTGKIVTFRP